MQKFEEISAKYGIKMAPSDHPIYSEGWSITFLSSTQKQSPPKAVASLPTEPPEDSDTKP